MCRRLLPADVLPDLKDRTQVAGPGKQACVSYKALATSDCLDVRGAV